MPSTAVKRVKKSKIISSHVIRSEEALTQAYALATVGAQPKQRQTRYVHVDYMEHLIRVPELRNTVRRVIAVLARVAPTFDAIAFRGNSGAILAPVVALALDKTLIMVRKKGIPEKGYGSFDHSYRTVEGDMGAETYVILDDIISTGATVETIVKEIAMESKAKCLGVLESMKLNDYEMDSTRPLAPSCEYGSWDGRKYARTCK